MKNWTLAGATITATLAVLALAATASANHGSAGTMLGGKDGGRVELTEKADGGHFDFASVEKADGGHFDFASVEKADGGHIELSTFGKKDGG